MSKSDKWLYFNIHNLVRMRVEAGHASERSVRLVFGYFEADFLDKVDLTLQYHGPEIGEHSFAGGAYVFTNQHVYIKKYKLHLVSKEDGFILAGKRDLIPFVTPVTQLVLMKRAHCFVHAAAVAISGRGVLLPGWRETGKTCAIVRLLKNVPNASFLSDDYSIISADGRLLSFPKAFFIYPYHKDLYPHLFKAGHKPLVPPMLSKALERIRTVVRPICMAFPRLENIARRITPEHMQTPARIALPDADFANDVPLDSVLFVERYCGTKPIVDEVSAAEAKRRLIGNWNYEQGQNALDMIVGAGGTGVMDLEAYYSHMAVILDKALANRSIYRLRIGLTLPADVGESIVETVRGIVSA